jgi:CUB/sushi domain-containing protein
MNESVVKDGYIDYGTQINVKCDIGHEASSNFVNECIQSGTLNGSTPECILVTCDHPGIDSVSNGNYTDENEKLYSSGYKNYLQTIHFVCNIGYAVTSGSSYRTCTENGTWNGTSPKCTLVTCDHPGRNAILNGNYTDGLGKVYLSGPMNYSQTLEIQCDTGYKVSSEWNVRTCQENGLWSSVSAECIIVTCPPLETVPYIKNVYSNGNFTFHSTVNVSCDSGTIQSGSSVRRCTENGTWDGTASTCGKTL